MKRTTVPISVLLIVLLISNAWWAFAVVDAGVTSTYQDAQLEEEQQALNQTLAVIRVLAKSGATRTQIVEAAQEAWSAGEPFEKDGYTWVGRLGLKFNEQGQLIDVVRG